LTRFSVVLALLILLALRNEARAGELQFSPDLCATDPGDTIHLALGRTVLRVPLNSLVYILDIPQNDEADVPEVPDPNEPEGCPDHPVQARAYTLRAALSEPGGSGDLSDSAGTRFVPFKLVSVSPDDWGMQPWAEKRFDKNCESFGVWTELENGLVACRVIFEDAPELDNDSAISYQARPEIYNAPFDKPFVVICSHLLGIGTQTCHIIYKLYPTVNFVQKFDLQRVDPANLVDVDRALRTWIENARVKDYQWPSVDAP
jgi:hypothetical protein